MESDPLDLLRVNEMNIDDKKEAILKILGIDGVGLEYCEIQIPHDAFAPIKIDARYEVS